MFRSKLVIILGLLFLNISASAQAQSAESIVPDFQSIIGGSDVQSGDPVAANTVLIVGKDGDSTFICSGSIIDRDIILTAAHCLGVDGLARVVVAFRTDIKGTGQIIPVSDRRRMGDFLDRAGSSPTDWHDLALVKLAQPIPAGYSIAKFLPSPNMLQNGSKVTLAGYGKIGRAHV